MAPEYDQNFFRLERHQHLTIGDINLRCYAGIPSEIFPTYSMLTELSVVLVEPGNIEPGHSEESRFSVSPDATVDKGVRLGPNTETVEGTDLSGYTDEGARYVDVSLAGTGRDRKITLRFRFGTRLDKVGFKDLWYWNPQRKLFVSVQKGHSRGITYKRVGASFVPTSNGKLFILPTHLLLDKENPAYQRLKQELLSPR